MPSKPKDDAAVERLVRKWWDVLPTAIGYGYPPEVIVTFEDLSAIIVESRQSAARECAEIARTKPCGSFCDVAIRERFDLEATHAR